MIQCQPSIGARGPTFDFIILALDVTDTLNLSALAVNG